jgi:FkbM family methyltransferase
MKVDSAAATRAETGDDRKYAVQSRAAEDYDQDTDIRLISALFMRLSSRVAIDVGAEKGSFVRAFLEHGAHKVIAVEPHPGNAAALRHAFDKQPAVEVLEVALGQRDEQTNLYIAEDKSGLRGDAYHSLVAFDETPTIKRVGAIPVQCRSLDSLVSEGTIPREIDALKIDAERSDLAILQGMGRLYAAVVMLEYWDDLPETVGSTPYRVSEVRDWMGPRGYSNFALIKRTGEFELIQVNEAHTSSGDWGNIVFIHDRVASQLMDVIFEAAASTQNKLIEQAKSFARECHARLSVIEEQQVLIDRLSTDSSKTDIVGDIAPGIGDHHQITEASTPIAQTGTSFAEAPHEPIESSPSVVPLLHRQTSALETIQDRLSEAAAAYESSRQNLEAVYEARLLIVRNEAATAEAMAAARLSVIEEQRRALEHYRFWSWPERMRRSWSPKLGVLYQHAPRAMHIPARYFQLPTLGSDAPTISIVTPSLNQGAFIERTIRSVINQGYPNLEYIVQDAASSDETQGILEHYAHSLAHVESRPDSGFGNGINKGFAHATGDILAYLNSDDLLLPGSLHSVARYFATHPEVDVVYGHRVVIDEYDAEIGRWVLPAHENDVLSWADYVPQETLFWRRRIWDQVGRTIDESFRFAIDWDLLLRFRDAGARMHRMPRFVGAFRVHPHQKTSSVMQDLGVHEMNQLRERCHGRRVTNDEIENALARYLRRHVMCHKLYRLGVLRY